MTIETAVDAAMHAIADRLDLAADLWRAEAIEGSPKYEAAAMAGTIASAMRGSRARAVHPRRRAPLTLLATVFDRIAADAEYGCLDDAPPFEAGLARSFAESLLVLGAHTGRLA